MAAGVVAGVAAPVRLVRPGVPLVTRVTATTTAATTTTAPSGANTRTRRRDLDLATTSSAVMAVCGSGTASRRRTASRRSNSSITQAPQWRQAANDPGRSHAGRGPPPVVAGHVSPVDVGQRSLHAEETEGRSEHRIIGDGNSVLAGTQPGREPERHEPLVDCVGEELSDAQLFADEKKASVATFFAGPAQRADKSADAMNRMYARSVSVVEEKSLAAAGRSHRQQPAEGPGCPGGQRFVAVRKSRTVPAVARVVSRPPGGVHHGAGGEEAPAALANAPGVAVSGGFCVQPRPRAGIACPVAVQPHQPAVGAATGVVRACGR